MGIFSDFKIWRGKKMNPAVGSSCRHTLCGCRRAGFGGTIGGIWLPMIKIVAAELSYRIIFVYLFYKTKSYYGLLKGA